jgi:hypothetical protein
LIVEKHGTPWWKARSGNVDFERFYAHMLLERNSDQRRIRKSIGIPNSNVAGKEDESVSITIRDLEKRVVHLEESLQEMKAFVTKKEAEPWWKRTAGAFKGDKMFEQIMREVRKARREDYEAVCREIDEREAKQKARHAADGKKVLKAKRPSPKRAR